MLKKSNRADCSCNATMQRLQVSMLLLSWSLWSCNWEQRCTDFTGISCLESHPLDQIRIWNIPCDILWSALFNFHVLESVMFVFSCNMSQLNDLARSCIFVRWMSWGIVWPRTHPHQKLQRHWPELWHVLWQPRVPRLGEVGDKSRWGWTMPMLTKWQPL